MSGQKDNKTKKITYKKTKTKRKFNIVMSRKLCTLAMFFRLSFIFIYICNKMWKQELPRLCSAQNPQICTLLISSFAYFSPPSLVFPFSLFHISPLPPSYFPFLSFIFLPFLPCISLFSLSYFSPPSLVFPLSLFHISTFRDKWIILATF